LFPTYISIEIQDDFKEAPITVTDAYKLYYKLKKKISEGKKCDPPSQESQVQRQPVEDVTNNSRLTPIIPQVPPNSTSQDEIESCKLKNVNGNENFKESTWGDHLNKPKFCPEVPQTEVSQSPRFNYSKLSEKLMKGAKIKIRSSLTRKPSLNLSSSSVKNSSNEFKSEDVTPESNASTPIDEPSPSKHLFGEVEEPETIFKGFKPKIVQNIPCVKQPFNLRGITSRTSKVSNRNVDIQWLDECLAAENITSKPSANYDQDIVYSSDDEQPRKAEFLDLKKKMPESSLPPAIGTKRKSEDISTSNKKPRMEASVGAVHEDFSPEETPILKNSQVTEHEENEKVIIKESSANSIKRERLARYLSFYTSKIVWDFLELLSSLFLISRGSNVCIHFDPET